MGLNAVVTWPKEDWGFDPIVVRRDAARRLRRPRARARHEPQRHPRVDVLPDVRRVQLRARSSRSADKDLALVMLQAYNDWHIDEWCGRVSRPLHPAGHPAHLGPARDGRRDPSRRRRRAARAMTMPELPHIQGLPELPRPRLLGPVLPGVVRRAGGDVPAHRAGVRRDHHRAPDAPIDNLIILATQVSAFAAQDLLWGPAFTTYPDLKVAWSEAGIGWIPFYLDRCDRHYRTSGGSGTTSATSCRATSSATTRSRVT